MMLMHGPCADASAAVLVPLPSLRGRRLSLLPSQDARTRALVATGALAVVPALAVQCAVAPTPLSMCAFVYMP
jgi:hypothetical protein